MSLRSRTAHNSSTEFKSDVVKVNVGVPQGSALAPTLFLMYINDMPDILDADCSSALYADDTSIIMSHSDDRALAGKCNSNLERMLSWYSQNSLYLNINKTGYIRFHNHQKSVQKIHISINNVEIQQKTSAKFLGVHLDEHMSWTEHCRSLVAKLNSFCYLFRNLRCILNTAQLITVYRAHIDSRLRYGITFWGSSTGISEVLICQKRVLRCLAGVKPRTSCRPIFKSLKLLTVVSLYIFELAVYIHKNKDCYTRHSELHGFDTRNRENFCIQFKRLNVSIRHADIMGLKIYNKLPKALKSDLSLNTFKNNLRTLLLENTVYSMEEFFALFLG